MTSALPITPLLPEISRLLAARGVLVLQAAPGAGKTTAVPPALLDAPWLAGRRILMLEPRRLAAIMAARRMAAQRHEAVGETVGYRVRLEQRIGPRTRIEVVTDGIFTRLIQSDPALSDYGLVIFDECHERSLQADLGLALALETRAALREDLRLLAMSATVAGQAHARLLGDAPVLECPGRAYPVALHYVPGPLSAAGRAATAQRVAAVRRALTESAGGILVFLPGVPEIRHLATDLEQADLGAAVRILPLYGDQAPEAQEAALMPAPAGVRKLVLSTAVAETSLTLADITTVIDTGLSRTVRFDPARAMEHLITVPVSRAAADQRAGRAGRQGPGTCYRLYAESTYERAPAQDEPEIRQADLAGLALELAVWGVADPLALRWLDVPHPARYAQARALLRALAALDGHNRITPHGRAMAQLGVHPRLAHLLLQARAAGQGRLACRVAAVVESRDALRQTQAAPSVDLHDRLALFDAATGGAAASLRRLADQLARRLGESGAVEAPQDTDTVGELVAWAYPERIAQRQGPGVYRLVSGRRARLDPGDALAGAPYLAVARLEGGDTEARIHLAAPLSEAALVAVAGERMTEETAVAFDAALNGMVARRRQCLGALVLRETPLPKPAAADLLAAWIAWLSGAGWERLPWTGEAARLRARLACMARLEPAGGWPQMDDTALREGLAAWLGPYLAGITRLAQIDENLLQAALSATLPAGGRPRLDRALPTHFSAPGGSRVAIDYAQDPPVLAVKLQELFGVRETPRLADGRLPLVVHLLSPAGRPLAITADLSSFWQQAYPEVRKQMRGRYPRHPWPDDPLNAVPTARVKPRPAP